MLYTVDRVQIKNNKLIFFEFFGNRSNEERKHANYKVARLMKKRFINDK